MIADMQKRACSLLRVEIHVVPQSIYNNDIERRMYEKEDEGVGDLRINGTGK